MPRHSREQSGTGIYHVMLRGVNRQIIFEDDEDNIRFISLLKLPMAAEDMTSDESQ